MQCLILEVNNKPQMDIFYAPWEMQHGAKDEQDLYKAKVVFDV